MEQVDDLDSMYAAYTLEFENVQTIYRSEIGFANFSLETKRENSVDIYIQEVYVVPEKRGNKYATSLTNDCIKNARKLYKKPVKTIYTSVGVDGETVNQSLRAITAFGFKLLKSEEKIIYFYKELTNE